MGPARKLTYRFLTLPYHVRLELANTLELLNDDDNRVTDRVLFQRVFRRAKEQHRLGQLWEAVENRHGAPDTEPNPYSGS